MKDEPVTQIVEVLQEKKEGMVVVSTLHGYLYLVDLLESAILKKLCLQEIAQSMHDPRQPRFAERRRARADGDNIVYSMTAYSSFNLEAAPFLVVHDRLDGVYMLNFSQRTKTSIYGHHYCKSKWAEPDLSEEEDSSGDEKDEAFYVKSKSSDFAQSLKDAEPFWEERFKSCQLCSHLSLPHRDGVVLHRNARQMLVVLGQRVQLVSYEAQAETPPG